MIQGGNQIFKWLTLHTVKHLSLSNWVILFSQGEYPVNNPPVGQFLHVRHYFIETLRKNKILANKDVLQYAINRGV